MSRRVAAYKRQGAANGAAVIAPSRRAAGLALAPPGPEEVPQPAPTPAPATPPVERWTYPRPRQLLPVDRIGVFGKTGTGKSFAVQQLLGIQPRVVMLDVNGEYWTGDGGVLREKMYAAELAARPRKVFEPNLSLAVVPDGDSPQDAARCLQLLSSLLRAARLPVTLGLEECGDWSTYVREELTTLATRGRHKGISLVAVAQRPALIHPNVRSQFSEVWAFRLDEPADVEALEERTRSKDFAAAVRRLPPRLALAWTANDFSAALQGEAP